MLRSFLWVFLGVALLAPSVAAQGPTSGPTVQAFLFGDAMFTLADGDGLDGFKLGQMVAHGNAILSDRVVFFGELSITGGNSGYGLAMERAILRYDFNDGLKLSVGRFHTPISFWNTAFHHGLWLQGSVARPESVRFGSRFIPVHFVGAMAEGKTPNAPVHYQVGIGNGRNSNIAAAGDGGDVNGHRAVIASASVRPASLFGFRAGASLYVDQVPAASGPDPDERIASGHVVWDRGAVDFVAEYIDVSHTLGSSAATGSSAYYLHLGYRLPGELRSVTPYARVENMDIDAGDAVFGGGVVADYEAVVVGIRYDFDALAALKVEYRNEKVGGAAGADAFFLQTSFAIPMFGG